MLWLYFKRDPLYFEGKEDGYYYYYVPLCGNKLSAKEFLNIHGVKILRDQVIHAITSYSSQLNVYTKEQKR